MLNTAKKYWKIALTAGVAVAMLIVAMFLPHKAQAQDASDAAATTGDNGHTSVCFITSPSDAGLLEKFKASAKEFGCTVGTWFSSAPDGASNDGATPDVKTSKPSAPTAVTTDVLEEDEDHTS